jgi:hypothetical protein
MTEILRHRHTNRFTVLPNDAIRNPSLSFRAVGVLAHLLSLPDGAKVDSATLAQAHREGRDAVRSAYKELADHGYYRREVRRLPNGTFCTQVLVSSIPMDPTEGKDAGRTEDGFSGVGPGPGNPAPVEPTPVGPAAAVPTPDGQATTEEEPTSENQLPPQPPRRAGGPIDTGSDPSSVAPGRSRSPRADGTNPRAEADRAETARLEAEAARRRAELEAATAARRAADLAAEAEAERLEAEARSVSAALDDVTLGAVVGQVRAGMPGLLAGSAVAVTRAVLSWCRTATVTYPGPFGEAVTAALADELVVGEGTALWSLDLPPAAPQTRSLRSRIAGLPRLEGGA